MKTVALFVCLLTAGGAQTPSGQTPLGRMKAGGKTSELTNAYAYAAEGFFDKKKDDTVVLLSDRPLTGAEARDEFGIRRKAEAGQLNFVKVVINDAGQLISFVCGSPAFKAIPSGGGTEHVFEGKVDGKSIAGSVRTKSEQEFFGTKYEYQATFNLPVQPKK